MPNKLNLKISERFVSLQGEGRYSGVPAFFWRLALCNLHCEFCDSVDVWMKGDYQLVSDCLISYRTEYEKLAQRNFHWVITGGEPLIQQEALTNLIQQIDEEAGRTGVMVPFIEIETAGTLEPNEFLCRRVGQWNVSPKLSNSGMDLDRRFHPEVLKGLALLGADFKFVIAEEDPDLEEVEAMVKALELQEDRIWLMPACTTAHEHFEIGKFVALSAVDRGWNFSPRLQIVLFDKTTGV